MGAPGWDDAPSESPPAASAKKVITLVWPYYDNPNFLGYQLGRLRDLPAELKLYLRLIVVDDCSPNYPAAPVMRGLPLPFPARLFRIDVDVRWNWLAARNIGMHHAGDFAGGATWCALTDIDHVWPEATLGALLAGRHRDDTIYRFCRREADGKVIHNHPNSFFLTNAMFWKIGGYDERLSGFYGSDGDWRRRAAAVAKIRTLPESIERHEFCGDSSTTGYARKQPIDAGKKRIIAARKGVKNWRPLSLSFHWHEVKL